MPSRLETFEKVLPAIHAQVDHVFVYLDGYSSPPGFLENFERVTVQHAEALGDLHASSRFLCLSEIDRPTVVVTVDDDIAYPPDYVTALVEVLERLEGQAVVGVHGRIFLPPHGSYVHDVVVRHFGAGMDRVCHVHELGVGTSAFVSNVFDFDPRDWARHDMDDIMVAIEAQKRGLPRIAIARAERWLTAYAQGQDDSLWRRAQTDDSEQSRQMRVLLELYAKGDEAAKPAKRSRAGGKTNPTPA